MLEYQECPYDKERPAANELRIAGARDVAATAGNDVPDVRVSNQRERNNLLGQAKQPPGNSRDRIQSNLPHPSCQHQQRG
jgi:hypothetical protein